MKLVYLTIRCETATSYLSNGRDDCWGGGGGGMHKWGRDNVLG